MDSEVARLVELGEAPVPEEQRQDAALREEIRQLVIARNERRVEGRAPLDVEAEIERQLEDFGWPELAGDRREALSAELRTLCKLACACRDAAPDAAPISTLTRSDGLALTQRRNRMGGAEMPEIREDREWIEAVDRYVEGVQRTGESTPGSSQGRYVLGRARPCAARLPLRRRHHGRRPS